MKKRAVQYFSDESLANSRGASPEEVLRFLEDFRLLQAGDYEGKSKLISIKIPEPLLRAFRVKAEREGVPYQTQIKRLMTDWVKK